MDLINLYYQSESEDEMETTEKSETSEDINNFNIEEFLDSIQMSEDENRNPNENFSLKEFIDEMDPSDLEEENVNYEVNDEQAEREREIDEEMEKALREEIEQREKRKFKKRTIPFPCASREDTVVCRCCKIPMNRRSLKNHLTKIHNIVFDDDEDWEDYAEETQVTTRIKKLKFNERTNEPEVQVVFQGESDGQPRKKIDVYPTKDVMGLKQFQKYVKRIEKNGNRNERRILKSEKLQQELKVTKIAHNHFGKWAHKKFKCVICYKTKRGFNVSVWNHGNNPTDVPHAFCTTCINKWCKGDNGRLCPTCNGIGYPIKMYHS